MKRITEAEWLNSCDGYEGYCLVCHEFTRDSTEPDAEEYDCPVCGGNTVYGTEQALVLGLLDVA
jgi:hypothetical protein